MQKQLTLIRERSTFTTHYHGRDTVEIEFQITHAPKSGAWNIHKAWIGNLVDPETGLATQWYVDPVTGNRWWNTPPAESQWSYLIAQPPFVPGERFGLNFEFEVEYQGDTSTQTAIGHIAADLKSFAGDQTVKVHLVPCQISPGEPQLKVTLESGQGFAVKQTQGQPSCIPPTPPKMIDILAAIDTEGACGSDRLLGHVYLFDTTGYAGSGTGLKTTVEKGDKLQWSVMPIQPSGVVSISGFSGPAVDDGVIAPSKKKGKNRIYYSSAVKLSALAGKTYPYSIEMGFRNSKSLSLDMSLVVK